MEMDKIRMRM